MTIPAEMPARRIQARKTTDGWQISLDDTSWANVMSALSIAIEASASYPEQQATFRTLRTLLSRG